jgi:hypothetical protein
MCQNHEDAVCDAKKTHEAYNIHVITGTGRSYQVLPPSLLLPQCGELLPSASTPRVAATQTRMRRTTLLRVHSRHSCTQRDARLD